ncbi:AraC family transcriptional regulator [Allonocardiopsis opalescens]|uniref:AraC family transcriptional regulator n=1 Tax=Allonocardiopsis opalescens TaxID=1144618 RepID=A0A2T0PYQ8_9ACTN|nr:AraC family transcriptional regulator [Allonocardiopsis opalescens]PRX96537.1 AraC family transcriptional regulator [Allonocardiopsis opalescens]
MRDQLSEVFDLVEIRGLVSGGFAAHGRWEARRPCRDMLKLIAMVSGHGRLLTDGLDEPVHLAAGDIAILNYRTWLRHEGGDPGPGPRHRIGPEENFTGLTEADRSTDDVVIGIAVDINPAGRELLLQRLPPVGVVKASAAAPLRILLDQLFGEVAGNRTGSAFAVRQYGQLLVLEVLRAYLDQTEAPPGWLRVLTDDRLRPALALMHAEPATSWSLEDLARAAAMSRSSFARRFRAAAGMPPLTYLSRYRMLLAQRALRHSDARVGSLAADLGYASEAAFSNAFKREIGESPLRYRHRVRGELPGREQAALA